METTPLEMIERLIGMRGRMIAGSKSHYRNEHPTHVVVFNANVCTEDKKLWYGDLDVTLDKMELIYLAKELNTKIYVLSEMGARFGTENKPALDNAVVVFNTDGTYELSESFKKYYTL